MLNSSRALAIVERHFKDERPQPGKLHPDGQGDPKIVKRTKTGGEIAGKSQAPQGSGC